MTDESDPTVGSACMTGDPGICFLGARVCQSGEVVCDGTDPGTVSETCNDQDDDCDGQVDEDVPGIANPCSTGFPGICASGTFICVNGQTECSVSTTPGSQVESCKELDDDCDGQTDEGGVCD